MNNVTEWFPAEMKPIHSGVYETKSPVFNDEEGWFSYWDGVKWHGAYSDVSGDPIGFATAAYKRDSVSWFQDRSWRGLAEKPA